MKKGLLIAGTLLFAFAANAQLLQRAQKVAPKVEKQQVVKARPTAELRTAQMNPKAPVKNLAKAPKKSVNAYNIGYYRPAGAFYNSDVYEDGLYSGAYYAPYIMLKPYSDYEFLGYATAGSDATTFEWSAQFWDSDTDEQVWVEGSGNPIVVQYTVEADQVPIMTAKDGSQSASYSLKGYKMGGTAQKPVIETEYDAHIMSVPDPQILADDPATEERHFSTAHFMGSGNRRGTEYYSRSYYHGAAPYDAEGEEGSGYWFGKNGQGVDGFATVFEKPTVPYALHGVAISFTEEDFVDDGQANLDVKVYKLDEMLPYNDEESVEIESEEPGELIAWGTIYMNADVCEESYGNLFCDLYETTPDGLDYEVTPTIDFPIMVVVEGYNDPKNEDLKNFSMLVSSDEEDEGFGEQTYVKYKTKEGKYIWCGLNNFFGTRDEEDTFIPTQMKVGASISIDARYPFLVFNYNVEDGEYEFPVEGGSYHKEFESATGETLVLDDIQLFNYYVPSEYWEVTLEDGSEIPEWLTLGFEDGEDNDGEFNGLTKVTADASALPDDIKGRKAVVKFAFPGAYILYTFTQGEVQEYKRGDINGDGAVDVSDVSLLIDVVLGKISSDDPQIKGDCHVAGGESIDVSDISALIDIVLGNAQ